MKAPKVVAKGKDLIAFHIRNIAGANDIPIVSAPPLSRALYFSTEIDHEIPSGLFLAVAQVLAYVYRLKNNIDTDTRPEFDSIDIPDEFRRDE
jgi:flagellar biosynthetic protein FlhB